MGNLEIRIRAKLGLWLIQPFLIAQRRRIYSYIEAGHKPLAYHKDWWWGQFFATEALWEDLEHSRLAVPYRNLKESDE